MCWKTSPWTCAHRKPWRVLINESLSHPEVKRAKEQTASADARLTATKRQYMPTVSAIASGGTFDPFDPRQNQQTGGWWMAGALVSMPLFTGFLIENQVVEATANRKTHPAATSNIEQALTQQVTNAYLDTLTFAQQIKLAEEQVRTAQEALQLSKQRYKLGLGTVVEVTQSEVAVTVAQTGWLKRNTITKLRRSHWPIQQEDGASWRSIRPCASTRPETSPRTP